VSPQNFYRGGRNSRSGHSPLLGASDPRSRGRAASGRTGDDLGQGLTLDDAGRQIADIDETTGLLITPEGKIGLDPKKLTSTVKTEVFNTTVLPGGTGGGGGGGTTIINNYAVDEVLPWIGW
jgi:hypothetical protein